MAVQLKMHGVHPNKRQQVIVERPNHATLNAAIRSANNFWRDVGDQSDNKGMTVFKIELVDTKTGKTLRTTYGDELAENYEGLW